MGLISDNTLVGINDDVPGVMGGKFPIKPELLVTMVKPSEIQTLYAHNVRISSMSEVDSAFANFLKEWNTLPGD